MRYRPRRPRVLVLGSRFDFTCDYVVAALQRRGVSYLRLNSEDLPACAVALDPIARELRVRMAGVDYLVTPRSLASVLFRRPVALRDYGGDGRGAQERFAQAQWAAFMTNIALFGEARWYNAPSSTYRAEQKAVQLWEATRIGFCVPSTVVTNAPELAVACLGRGRVALKGLDTVLVREHGEEVFGFTTFAELSELDTASWSSAPGTLQRAVPDKIDVRVTVVEEHAYAAAVLVDGQGVSDDWRLHKQEVKFVSHELPSEIRTHCVELVRALGLRFAAIDLALSHRLYHFLEINPTGEWAWLVDSAGLPIDEAIADALAR